MSGAGECLLTGCNRTARGGPFCDLHATRGAVESSRDDRIAGEERARIRRAQASALRSIKSWLRGVGSYENALAGAGIIDAATKPTTKWGGR